MNRKDFIQDKLEAIFRLRNESARIDKLSALSGGASAETWLFDVVSSEARQELILRSSSSDDVAFGTGIDKNTEAALQKAAYQAGVPVAKVVYVLTPEDELGMGYIMERHQGETIARKILRDDRFAKARAHMAAQCGYILANIHSIDLAQVPELPDQRATQQLEQMKALYQSFNEPVPVFNLACQWLSEHLPENQPAGLVHGDFRNGNFIVTEEGINTVLDWELSHIGDPMEDLGWLCVNSWRFGVIDKPVGGFGEREDLFSAYEKASGLSVNPDIVKFWEVFGTFKWGVICLYQTFAHLNHHIRSVERAAIGRRVSETEIDLLRLIAPRNKTP